LADRCGAGAQLGDSEDAEFLAEDGVVQGLAGAAAAVQPGAVRVGRVVVFSRLVRCSSSRPANGSGTGEGGDPRPNVIWSPSRMTSSVLTRMTRLTGWA
jgi:hypothetical protein